MLSEIQKWYGVLGVISACTFSEDAAVGTRRTVALDGARRGRRCCRPLGLLCCCAPVLLCTCNCAMGSCWALAALGVPCERGLLRAGCPFYKLELELRQPRASARTAEPCRRQRPWTRREPQTPPPISRDAKLERAVRRPSDGLRAPAQGRRHPRMRGLPAVCASNLLAPVRGHRRTKDQPDLVIVARGWDERPLHELQLRQSRVLERPAQWQWLARG